MNGPGRARAAVVTPGRGVGIDLVDLNAPAAGEAVVRSRVVGICGSDTHALAGIHPFLTGPYVPGHEAIGVVEQVGSPEDAGWVGRRVVLKPNVACGSCDTCRAGRTNVCLRLEWIGCDPTGAHPGALAERFLAPLTNLFAVPDQVPDETAVLIECLSTPVHAVRRLPVTSGARILILGAGTIGLLTSIAARAVGAASIVMTDLDPGKRSRARRLGADAAVDPLDADADVQIRRALGGSPDAVLDCVANQNSMADAVRLVVRGGTIVVVGVPAGDTVVPLHVIQDDEIDVRGCASFTEDDLGEAIRLAAAGMIPAGDLIEAEFGLDRVGEAFETASSGASGKVIMRLQARPANRLRGA